MVDTLRIKATVTCLHGDLAGENGKNAGAFIRTLEIPGLVVAESRERCDELLDELLSLTGKALVDRHGVPLTSAYLASRGLTHHILAPESEELAEGQFRHEGALA